MCETVRECTNLDVAFQQLGHGRRPDRDTPIPALTRLITPRFHCVAF